LEALEQRYEASVDPFRQFSRTERQRKLQEMSPMERAVFVVAKAMLGTKEMRTALFFYILAMHLLVFITTYHWSHELGCEDLHSPEHLSHLPPVMRNGQAASHAHEALADAGHT
jgi:homeobox protein cut-like